MSSTRHTEKTSNFQYTPNKTRTHAKNPTMTLIPTANVSTDDKQENVIVEEILKEQQKAIAYLKRKVALLGGKIFELKRQIYIAETIIYYSTKSKN